MTSVLESNTNHQEVLEDVSINVRTLLVPNSVPHSPQTHLLAEEEEEEISDEELACSYAVLCKSWVNTIKINENLQGQVL